VSRRDLSAQGHDTRDTTKVINKQPVDVVVRWFGLGGQTFFERFRQAGRQACWPCLHSAHCTVAFELAT
jgi:hypothetical protein